MQVFCFKKTSISFISAKQQKFRKSERQSLSDIFPTGKSSKSLNSVVHCFQCKNKNTKRKDGTLENNARIRR